MTSYARRMAITPDAEVAFDEADLAEVVAILDELVDTGAGWVNLLPEVQPGEEVPPRNLVALVFSARGEPVPMVTWSTPEEPGGPCSVGIEHGSGPRALDRLAAAGVALPTGWRRVADHPRRGLVLAVPPDARHHEVLSWLLRAAHHLTVPPLTGSWLARVYRAGS
jgi:hypothetical protein